MRSNHEILEIKPGASKDEIKKAFRRLAHIHHPDKGGDSKKFSEINSAYTELMKEEPTVHFWQTPPNENWKKKHWNNQQEQSDFDAKVNRMYEQIKQQQQKKEQQEEYARKMYGDWGKQSPNTGTEDLLAMMTRHRQEKSNLETRHRSEINAFWSRNTK